MPPSMLLMLYHFPNDSSLKLNLSTVKSFMELMLQRKESDINNRGSLVPSRS